MAHWECGNSRQDPEGGFGDYAKQLFDKPELSDVAIVLDHGEDLQKEEEEEKDTPTKTFHGHRVILATMSDYFRTMLFGSFVEAGKKEIRLTGVPYSLFMDLMRYVYLGWNPPSEKSLEELVEYYSLARMLLLDAKMKPCFDRWMATKVEESPEDVLKLLSLALEWGLRHLKAKCTEHFCLIANEYLAFDSFAELPLETVQYILDLDDKHCRDTDLKTAVQAWINHHKAELSAKTIEELNEDLDKHSDYCFDTEDFDEQSLYEDPKDAQKTPEEQPAVDLVPLDDILNSSKSYSYRCDFRVTDCVVLKAVKINLRPNLQYGPQYGRIKSEFQLDFEVGVSTEYREHDEYNRSLTVRYDFTQGNDLVPVTIFFPDFYCCKGTRLWFELDWHAAGVQPLLQEYGSIPEDYGTFLTESSFISHMIYKYKYRCFHSDSERSSDEFTGEEDDDF